MNKTESMPVVIKSFKPVVDQNSRVLILGTMPGEESLRQQQYYAHPRNLFWPLIYTIFNKPQEQDYGKRIQFLYSNRIALWDVFKSCEREGSLDNNIRKEESNDIAGLLEAFPNIRYVFCNGGAAWKQFQTNGFPFVKRPVFGLRLPSTSPANASIPYETKLEQWSKIRFTLENRILHETSIQTETGTYKVLANDKEVIRVCLPGSDKQVLNQFAVFPENGVSIEAAEQIKEYLAGKRKCFNIPYRLEGSSFAINVYQALLEVPFGCTISYGELAERAGNKKAAQAVGQIMLKNPVPLIVPCHRVIGSTGKNIGFMGIRGNPIQNMLLKLEQNRIAEEDFRQNT